MDKLLYFAEADGIAVEHMQRIGQFNMRVKHFHNEYEIFFIIDGERHFFLDNRAYFVKKGSLILVDENKIHMTKSVTEEDSGHERVILYVGKDKMRELDEKFPRINLVKFFRENYGIFHLNEDQQQQFLNMYHTLKKEFVHKKRNYKTMIEMEVIQYFVNFMRENYVEKLAQAGFDNNPKYRTVYAAADYISENYTQKISLDELANQYYLSKYYFCRTFKEITGYGISEYINIHRIQKAKRLLEETDLTVSDIAHNLGYESLTHFEKVFKTYMTLSPLKYRKTLNIITYTNT